MEYFINFKNVNRNLCLFIDCIIYSVYVIISYDIVNVKAFSSKFTVIFSAFYFLYTVIYYKRDKYIISIYIYNYHLVKLSVYVDNTHMYKLYFLIL